MITMYDLYQKPFWLVGVILIIILWTIIWKGLGLWYAAKNKQKGWFVVLLVFNTLGILPLVYLLWNRPKYKQIENKKQELRAEPKKNTTKLITIKKKNNQLVSETKKEAPKQKVDKKDEVKKKKIRSKKEIPLNEDLDEMSMQL